ncbi:MAG: hypothetical protein ACYDH3_05280 [Candidatus Aminicenantales bacterium]
MKNASRFLVLALCLLLSFSSACKKSGESASTGQPADKYAALKDTMTTYVSLLETCAKEVEGATEAAAIAAALNTMNDGMTLIAPKIKFMGRDYPELDNPANIPADLKTFMDKMDEIHPVMMTAMQKANTFASDPVVQLALGRFAEIQKLME